MATILAVDDNPNILEIICSVAEEMGHVVEAVGDAASFKRAFVRLKPEIAVLDIVMPGTDGIELITWLAETGAPPRVVITSGALGGYCELASDLARALMTSSVLTLPKPFRLSELRTVLQ